MSLVVKTVPTCDRLRLFSVRCLRHAALSVWRRATLGKAHGRADNGSPRGANAVRGSGAFLKRAALSVWPRATLGKAQGRADSGSLREENTLRPTGAFGGGWPGSFTTRSVEGRCCVSFIGPFHLPHGLCRDLADFAGAGRLRIASPLQPGGLAGLVAPDRLRGRWRVPPSWASGRNPPRAAPASGNRNP
jgi:hypothetical protein